MTVASTYVPPQYIGNGITIAFPFPFPYFAATDLSVVITDSSIPGLVTPAPILNGGRPLDYTVTGTIDPTGTGEYLYATLTFNTAPTSTQLLTVYRNVPAVQNTALTNSGPFPAKSIEAAFDRLTIIDQQTQSLADRAIIIPLGDSDTLNLTLPAASLRALQTIIFDAEGNVAVGLPVAGATVVSLAMQPVIAAATIAAARALLQIPYSVKDFGATGNGITDDTIAVQAALNLIALVGGTLRFPAGKYLISGAGLTLNKTTLATLADLTRVSLVGDGAGNTQIYYTGTGTALQYTGSTLGSGSGVNGFFSITGLQIVGTSTTGGSIGLGIALAAYFAMRDVFIQAFNLNLNLVDCLSCKFEMLTLIWAAKGMNAANGVFSPPNAITLDACTIGLNTSYGALIYDCDCFTMTGGSIESNGTMASGWGIQLLNPGDDGAVAGLFMGVHFENNASQADILVNTSATAAQAVAVTTIGCLFDRNSSATYVTNAIQVNSNAGNGPVKLNVFGCGFRGFGTYAPSSARPYIALNRGGGVGGLTEFGNVYASSLEAPQPSNVSGPIVSPRAVATAWVNFGWSGSAIGISDSHNILSVTRSSTGVYVVTFAIQMNAASYVPDVCSATPGFIYPSNVGINSFQINCTNSAGTPVDPTNVYGIVFGGAPF